MKLGRASATGDEGEEGNRREGEGKRRSMGRGRSGFAWRGSKGKEGEGSVASVDRERAVGSSVASGRER